MFYIFFTIGIDRLMIVAISFTDHAKKAPFYIFSAILCFNAGF